MKKFQYQTLRYMPDRVCGEFVNLGVVVLAEEPKALLFRFYNKIRKAARLFSQSQQPVCKTNHQQS